MRKLYIFFVSFGLLALLFNSGCGGSKDFETLSNDGKIAFQDGDYEEAVELYSQALHFKPSDKEILYQLGVSFSRLNENDSALAYLHRADILYPADYNINKELFRLCSITEDYECALSAVHMLIANGDSEEMFWIPLADLNFFYGNYKLARKYYQLLLNDNPREGRYYWNLAECYKNMNRPKEALETLKKAVSILGPNPVAYTQIAINHITLKEYDQAEIYYRKAIEFEPKNVALWINMAHVLAEQGTREKKEEALAIYKLYLIDTPEIFKLDSLIKVLEEELGES